MKSLVVLSFVCLFLVIMIDDRLLSFVVVSSIVVVSVVVVAVAIVVVVVVAPSVRGAQGRLPWDLVAHCFALACQGREPNL